MFSIQNLSCLDSLVGFKQTRDGYYPEIDSDLVVDNTQKRVVNEGVITNEHLSAILPDYNRYRYPDWTAGTYVKYDLVTHNNVKWVSSVDNNTDTPQNGSNWVGLDNGGEGLLFSRDLRDIIQNAKTELIDMLVTYKKINMKTKTLLQSTKLYGGISSLNDLLVSDGSFVGYEINLKDYEGLTVEIDKIGTTLTQTNNFDISVFHSSQLDNITSRTIDHNKPGSQQWTVLDQNIMLNNSSDSYENSGSFYIGFFQDDITGSIINRDINFQSGCNSCQHVQAYRKYSRYFTATPIKVRSENLNGVQYWQDVDYVEYPSSRTWGLNLSMKVNCDIDDIICRNIDVLAYPLKLMVQIKLLREIVNSTELNNIEQELRVKSEHEIDVQENPSGIMGQFYKSLKGLSFEFSDLKSPCYPCDQRGIKIRTT